MKSHLQLISTTGMNREEWLQYRFTGIGASEVGAVLGLDDYMSSLELYYLKIGDAPRMDIEGMAAFMGREQEDLIARMWQYWDGSEEGMISNYRTGVIIRKCRRINAFVRNPQYPWLFVSLDRIANAHANKGEGALELKTIGIREAEKWEAGVPPKYVTQVQTQMLIPEFDFAEMALLQDARKFFVLPFERSQVIMDKILEVTKSFWDKVEAGRKLVGRKYQALAGYDYRGAQELSGEIDALAPEPDGSLAYAKYLSERFNAPAKALRTGTVIEEEEARRHKQVAEQIKALVEEKNLHESRLRAAMGNDVQVLDFGAAGKVHWSVDNRGYRIFRNNFKG